MIRKKIGRLEVELYGNINELPSERYHKFNLYCLMSAGIGNDTESVIEHIQGMYTSLAKKDTDRLMIQLQNYHHALHLILEKQDTQSLAFACLVAAIDGKPTRDISDDGLQYTQYLINREEKRLKMLAILNELKKKLKARLRYIFLRR